MSSSTSILTASNDSSNIQGDFSTADLLLRQEFLLRPTRLFATPKELSKEMQLSKEQKDGEFEDGDSERSARPPLPLKVGALGLKSAQMLQQLKRDQSHHEEEFSPQENSQKREDSSNNWIELSSSSSSFKPLKSNHVSSSISVSARRKMASDLLGGLNSLNGLNGLAQAASACRLIQPDEAILPLLASQQQEISDANEVSLSEGSFQSSPGHALKGPAPQPPNSSGSVKDNAVIMEQPHRSSSVSRGLQVEPDDLIQFSQTNNSEDLSTKDSSPKNNVHKSNLNNNSEKNVDLEDDLDLDDEDRDSNASARTADEQMDYLESLEPCPCYAKCCIDSVITLFCVTLLG